MGVSDEIRNISVSLSNILFAMDFTPSSLRAYPYAADIALHYAGKVLVAQIVPSDKGDAMPSAEQNGTAVEAGWNDGSAQVTRSRGCWLAKGNTGTWSCLLLDA